MFSSTYAIFCVRLCVCHFQSIVKNSSVTCLQLLHRFPGIAILILPLANNFKLFLRPCRLLPYLYGESARISSFFYFFAFNSWQSYVRSCALYSITIRKMQGWNKQVLFGRWNKNKTFCDLRVCVPHPQIYIVLIMDKVRGLYYATAHSCTSNYNIPKINSKFP